MLGAGSCNLSGRGDPFWEQAVQRGVFNTTFLHVSADGAGEETVGSVAPCDPQLQFRDLRV